MKKIIYSFLMMILVLSMTGFVLGQENCIEEGNSFGTYPLPNQNITTKCCDGLNAISVSYAEKELCYTQTDGLICTKCGNGECGLGENKCNCPKDCSSNTTTPPTQTCTDSDGGINKNEVVTTTGKNPEDDNKVYTRTDHCWESNQYIDLKGKLTEYYCDENGNFAYKDMFCDNNQICKDGACIQEITQAKCTANSDCPVTTCAEGSSCPSYKCIEGTCKLQGGEGIKEKVTCIFKNSNTEQKCYLGKGEGLHEGTSCSGIGSCIIDVNGYKGVEVVWKSSCGGYAYTKVDGVDENAEFDCSAGETTTTQIINKGFRYAYWQCYDGYENKAGDGNACYPSDNFNGKAKDDCANHCKGEKCGINSFSVNGECYVEATATTGVATDVPAIPIATNVTSTTSVEISPETLVCKDSCPLDGKCYPFGYRKSGNYCTDSGSFSEQLTADSACDNNFECSSNVCVSGKCVDAGFLQKIMNWFKRMFGSG